MITKDDLRDVGKEFKQSPVAFVNNILKKKFTLAILIHIWFLKEHRFGELITIRSLNSKTLTLTLRNMTQSGLIRKKSFRHHPQNPQNIILLKRAKHYFRFTYT